MATNPVIVQALQILDQYKVMLNEALSLLSTETVVEIIEAMTANMQNDELDIGDRLESHAALVGVLIVMHDAIASKELEDGD